MTPKQILKKAANYKKIECNPIGCPLCKINLHKINSRDDQFIIRSLYRFLFGYEKNNENRLSSCSEIFLSICFEYNKEKTRKLFDKYKKNKGRINFYLNGFSMPCDLLGEMANFMIKSSTCLDIE